MELQAQRRVLTGLLARQDTGGCPDNEAALQSWVERLTRMVDTLEKENQALAQENHELEMELRNQKLAAVPQTPQALNMPEAPEPVAASEPGAGGDNAGHEEVLTLSDEAARKRLWRLCKRGADGRPDLIQLRFFKKDVVWLIDFRSLQVPEDIHNMYMAGGADKNKLLNMLKEANFNKARRRTAFI